MCIGTQNNFCEVFKMPNEAIFPSLLIDNNKASRMCNSLNCQEAKQQKEIGKQLHHFFCVSCHNIYCELHINMINRETPSGYSICNICFRIDNTIKNLGIVP